MLHLWLRLPEAMKKHLRKLRYQKHPEARSACEDMVKQARASTRPDDPPPWQPDPETATMSQKDRRDADAMFNPAGGFAEEVCRLGRQYNLRAYSCWTLVQRPWDNKKLVANDIKHLPHDLELHFDLDAPEASYPPDCKGQPLKTLTLHKLGHGAKRQVYECEQWPEVAVKISLEMAQHGRELEMGHATSPIKKLVPTMYGVVRVRMFYYHPGQRHPDTSLHNCF